MTDREQFEAWWSAYADTGYVKRVEPIARSAWQAATDAALERAAEVCVDISAHQLTFQQRKSAATCAEAIRALKEQP